MRPAKSHAAGRVGAMCLALGLAVVAGCKDRYDEFREAVSPSLQAGMSDILLGLTEGLFAVVDPDEDQGAPIENSPTIDTPDSTSTP